VKFSNFKAGGMHSNHSYRTQRAYNVDVVTL